MKMATFLGRKLRTRDETDLIDSNDLRPFVMWRKKDTPTVLYSYTYGSR